MDFLFEFVDHGIIIGVGKGHAIGELHELLTMAKFILKAQTVVRDEARGENIA